MKTIFHVGHSKTGSTTLQSVFLESQAQLIQKGVLYPSNPNGRYNNHKLLSADLMEPGKVPRHIIKNYIYEELPAARIDLQNSIMADIERHKPKCLMLSSETRFGLLPKRGRVKFRQILQGFGSDDIDIVAYVRLPSGWFLSALNQSMRRTTSLKQPRILSLHRAISSFIEDFGQDHVHILPFSRDALRGGDIVKDFCSRFLSDYGVSAGILQTDESSNESLSSEAIDIVRRYRLQFLPKKDNQFVPDGEKLIKLLMKAEASLKMPKPRLRDGLTDILDYGTPIVRGLRDDFGVVIPGYDYDRAEKTPEMQFPEAHKLEEIIEIDRAMQFELIASVRRDSWVRSDESRASWFDRLPGQISDDTGTAPVYQAASMPRMKPSTSKEESLIMTDANTSTRSPEEQADRDLAVTIGRAIFRTTQGDLSNDARKAAWQAERKDYVKQGRAVLKRLRKDGITLSK